MAKYSTSLTRANSSQPLSWKIDQYVTWLRADPSRRAYVFPESCGNAARSVRNGLKARGVTVIEVNPNDYSSSARAEGAAIAALAA